MTNGKVDALLGAANDEMRRQCGPWPNCHDAADYTRLAEAMGLKAQVVCNGAATTGAYYTVVALYDVDYIFGAEPLAVIFEDFSKSVPRTEIMVCASSEERET